MAISPYDNLPIGNTQNKQSGEADSETTAEAIGYVEVDLNDMDAQAQNSQDMPEDTEEAAEDTQEVPQITEASEIEPETSSMENVEPRNEPSEEYNSQPPDPSPRPQPLQQQEQPKQPQPLQQQKTPERLPSRDIAKTVPLEKAPQYSTMKLKNRWGVKEYTLAFEESLLVPDTMPDMSYILFAEARATMNPSGKNTYEKNDFLSGNITLYTVYQPDGDRDSPIDVVKSSVPFRTDKCWEGTEADSFRVTVSIKSVNAEMINERKFAVSGELLICLTEICNKELSVFKGTGTPDFVQLEKSLTVTDLSFEAEDSTEISQDINIREDQPSPVKILKETIDIVENHKQITSGKLVINATINSSILYMGKKDGSGELSCITNKTDFTQFILIKGDEDINLIKSCFNSDDLKITIENQDKFLLQGQVRTFIQGYTGRDINMVSDTYHKNRDVSFDLSEELLAHVIGTVSGEITAREVLNLKDTDKKPESLVCGSGQLRDVSARPERGRVVIEGTMLVNILALDDEKKPFIISSSIPLRGSLEMPADGEDFSIDISAAIREFWFDEINSRQMEINVSVAIDVWMSREKSFKTIQNLCFAEPKDPAKRIPMAVYVVNHNDTLWDIAKRYKSDTKTLAELNQIDELRPLPEGMKLFVMK